jgi:hypothetical protein
MNLKERLRVAGAFASKHLVASALVAGLCAALVFGVWYPYPYSELASGRELFMLLVSVDLVIGPLLTLVVYNPKKPRRELWRDVGTVFVLQLAALGYGLHIVAQARPVLLAFEGDRFRVVAVPDIDPASLAQAPTGLSQLSWTGPQPIGVKLLEPSDAEYPQSILLAMQGVHPAFRPARWVHYDGQRQQVIRMARPLAELKRKGPEQASLIDKAVQEQRLREADLGYFPLLGAHHTDWIVAVDRKDGSPKLYLPIDGW